LHRAFVTRRELLQLERNLMVVAALRLDGIESTLRGNRILAGVSFAVSEGSLTGLIGLNGAGKTTTLRVLLGLLTPDRGTSQILGVASNELSRLGRRLGVQLHGGGLDPALTPAQTLRYTVKMLGVRDADLAESLRRVDLAHLANRRASKLSAGERQRLALARALVLRPDVLVLDEPLTHLDPGAAERIVEVLRAEVSRGVAVLLSSHQLEFLDRAANHVVFMHRGTVIAEGSPHDLLGGDDVTLELAAAPRDKVAGWIAQSPHVVAFDLIDKDGDAARWRVRIARDKIAELNAGLVAAGCRVSCLAPLRRSLHDLFLERVRSFATEGAAA
jgi:ABC-type multidrug transport system ATPase subunit